MLLFLLLLSLVAAELEVEVLHSSATFVNDTWLSIPLAYTGGDIIHVMWCSGLEDVVYDMHHCRRTDLKRVMFFPGPARYYNFDNRNRIAIDSRRIPNAGFVVVHIQKNQDEYVMEQVVRINVAELHEINLNTTTTTTTTAIDTTTRATEETTRTTSDEPTTTTTEETIRMTSDDTTTTAAEATTTPAVEEMIAHAADETTRTAIEETTAPAVEETTTPAAEETTTAAVEETTTPAAEETTTLAADEITTTAIAETTTAAVEATTTTAVEETTTATVEEDIASGHGNGHHHTHHPPHPPDGHDHKANVAQDGATHRDARQNSGLIVGLVCVAVVLVSVTIGLAVIRRRHTNNIGAPLPQYQFHYDTRDANAAIMREINVDRPDFHLNNKNK